MISLLALSSNLVCSFLVCLSDEWNQLSLSFSEEENETESHSNPSKRFNLLEEEMEYHEHAFLFENFKKNMQTKKDFGCMHSIVKTRYHHNIIDNPPELS